MAETGKLKLQSNDREMFEVDRDVALKSETVKNMIDDVEPSAADQAIPLPNVSGKILAKVIEYCKYHVDAEKGPSQEKTVPTEDERRRGTRTLSRWTRRRFRPILYVPRPLDFGCWAR